MSGGPRRKGFIEKQKPKTLRFSVTRVKKYGKVVDNSLDSFFKSLAKKEAKKK